MAHVFVHGFVCLERGLWEGVLQVTVQWARKQAHGENDGNDGDVQFISSPNGENGKQEMKAMEDLERNP